MKYVRLNQKALVSVREHSKEVKGRRLLQVKLTCLTNLKVDLV